ncbi:hypothetical protein COY28_02020 [Candidatus Woesearchaeota archaeon CG_4_10_14_0_2_um_filter_57_5]|nr:MAG: hypothetical protein AUJ68_03170 [Candidatus Woesearchaeota archaeon CG1_02_57_44]PIN70068.1 MAG: hypothetical protein COV94_02130 [Candidatus Woesearchaeota archaeon CG11_big_fil_rev_8_21_14_0_20_57_5]PIZ55276.1 MAG: hypothetical protein COY28_02020 [Candidatus Woesearchaeota archaeon CG_4_10_14_0_2_um_filter_57_5]
MKGLLSPTRLGRKGLAYTTIALILVTAMALLMRNHAGRELLENPAEARVRSMDQFITDLHQDAPRATGIIAYRAFLAMDDEMANASAYFSSPSVAMQEALLNGTLHGHTSSLLVNSTLTGYLSRVQELTSDIGILTALAVSNISLSQESPWHVRVSYLLTVNLTDARGVARWDYTEVIVASIPIVGLRDPLHTVGTKGLVPAFIQPHNGSALVNGLDTTELQRLINNSQYLESANAPSFLDRLSGNLTSSEQGIQTIVNIGALLDQGVTIHDASRVDYLYFDNESMGAMGSLACNFANTSLPWLALDIAHLDDFELTGLNYTSCG